MKAPLISVVMCVYNGEKWIDTAVSSILNQTYSNFELIVVNDYSSDTTLQHLLKIRDKRVRLINNNKNYGVAFSLNKALKITKGKYVARMDADDKAVINRLKKQSSFLEENPSVAAVGTWAKLITESGKLIKIQKVPCYYSEIKSAIIKFNPLIHPTIMIRKNILDEIGFYNVKYEGAEDYDLFLRLANRYTVVNIPTVGLIHRVHSDAVTQKRMKYIEIQSLRVRLNAIRQYQYSYWKLIYLIRPILFLFIPTQIKQFYASKN